LNGELEDGKFDFQPFFGFCTYGKQAGVLICGSVHNWAFAMVRRLFEESYIRNLAVNSLLIAGTERPLGGNKEEDGHEKKVMIPF